MIISNWRIIVSENLTSIYRRATEADKQNYQTAANEHWGLIQEHIKKQNATKAEVKKTLLTQADHRARAQQNEIDRERNDLR